MSDSLKVFYDDEPSDKLIAIYSDGSDCNIYFKKGDSWYPSCDYDLDDDGVDAQWFMDAGYLFFIPLPDDFEIQSLIVDGYE